MLPDPKALERAAMGVVSAEEADAWLGNEEPLPAPPWPEDVSADKRQAAPPARAKLPTYAEIPPLRSVGSKHQTWLVEDLIPEGAIVLLTGDGGAGKSTLATAWAGHIANGVPFCGREVQRRDVLVLDRENPPAVVLNRMSRLSMNDGPSLKFWGGWLSEPAPDPGSGWVLSWVKETEPKPLLIVDSAIAFLGGDENSSTDVRRFLDQLRAVTQLGASVVVIHHNGKAASAADFRGSSDFKNGVDIGYLITNMGDPSRLDRVSLKAFKFRIQVTPNLILDFDSEDGAFTERNVGAELTHEILNSIVRDEPGIGKRELEQRAQARGVGQRTFRRWLDSQERDGVIVRDQVGKRHCYRLKDDSTHVM